MTFGERLKTVRKRKGPNQADIGKKIDINGDTYGRHESIEVRPTAHYRDGCKNSRFPRSIARLPGRQN